MSIAAAFLRCGQQSKIVLLNARQFASLKQLANGFKSSAQLRSGGVKTPVQEWGWQYLQRQKALKRPIAPHLTVYQPQLTWMVSGAFRVAGVMMTCGVILLSTGLLFSGYNFTQLTDWIRSWNLPRPIVYSVKWIIAFFISFHMYNGIRFLGFDLALGISMPQVYKTGYFVVALGALTATLVAGYKPHMAQNQVKQRDAGHPMSGH